MVVEDGGGMRGFVGGCGRLWQTAEGCEAR